MDLGVMARKEEESWSRFITDGNVQDATNLISQGSWHFCVAIPRTIVLDDRNVTAETRILRWQAPQPRCLPAPMSTCGPAA